MKNLAYKLKKQQIKSNIVSIKDQTRTISIKGKPEIAEEFAKYYKQLYSPDNSLLPRDKIKKYLSGIKLPQITDKQNATLTLPIKSEEIKAAINKLKKGKCPGSDGYTAPFLIKFLIKFSYCQS